MKIHAAIRLQASNNFDDLTPHLEHAHWCGLLDSIGNPNKVIAFDLWKPFRDNNLTQRVADLFDHLKNTVSIVSKELKLDVSEIIEAFKTKPMFAFFKVIKFSIKSLLKPIKAFSELYKLGIIKVFKEIHDSKLFQKLNEGAIKLDDFLDQFPILKKLAGPAIAGLLIWMFLSGNCTYHPDMDMDLVAVIKAALYGSWSVHELFTSPQGLLAIGLLLTGLAFPWPSPAWLSTAVPTNLLIAFTYTAFAHLKGAAIKQTIKHIQAHMKFVRLK